jgi:SAM-dependent methyltransferase
MVTARNFMECDALEKIPQLYRDSYNLETEFVLSLFALNATVLQIGSMDGARIMWLLEKRPDVQITGLEIDEEVVKISKENFKNKAIILLGDITNPPHLGTFDYVICLNNTSRYIKDYEKEIQEMKKLGKMAIISVYAEKFTDDRAKEYFTVLQLPVATMKTIQSSYKILQK